MRVATVLSSVLLSTSLVAGCGSAGSSSSTYCKDLKAAKADFASIQSDAPDYSHFSEAIATLRSIAAEAPGSVAKPWKSIDDLIANLEKSLADVGISLKEFGDLAQGNLPDGMTATQVQQLAPKLEKAIAGIDNAEFKKASDEIVKDTKSRCNLDLVSG